MKVVIIVCVVVALAGAGIGYWMKHHDDDYLD
jgi:hypothetical protein